MSVRRGEPTVLAITETLAASGVSFWLAWKWDSIDHIVVASAIAPLLLLRTKLSTRHTMNIWRKIASLFIVRGISVTGPLYAFPIAKLIGIFDTTLRHPLRALQSVPLNLYISLTIIDSATPPTFLPGTETEHIVGKFFNTYNFSLLLFSTMRRHLGMHNKISSMLVILRFVKMTVIVMPILLLALSYRWSIKSTALLWMPLMWIVVQSKPGKSVTVQYSILKLSAWAKMTRIYSIIFLTGFTAKLALLFGAWNLAELDWLGPLGVAATKLVAPYELPLWQVAGAANALLAWAMFFRADQHLLARGTPEAASEVRLRQEYASFQAVRTTLSLYAIACTFYISMSVAWQTDWPPIRFMLFPWTA